MDDSEVIGRARPGAINGGDQRPQHQWLLLVALLALGYGFYSQLDRIRTMLAPEPAVESKQVSATPAVTPPLMVATPVPAPITAPRPQAPVAEPERPAVVLPPEPRPPSAPLRELFPVSTPPATEPVRLAGRAGLVEALRAGEIRTGSSGDIGRWKSSYTHASGRHAGRHFDERIGRMDVFVVQKDFEIPEGLAGAHAVVFVLEAQSPFPRGDAGHSPILDAGSGACIGLTCRMLLTDD